MTVHSGFFKSYMIRFLFYLLFLSMCFPASSQPLAGTTGLLNIPSGNMQEAGTFMTGANYLPIALTPSSWDYNTGNYYLNITFLRFMEVSYRMTLLKPIGYEVITNQDRALSVRFRVVKEKEYLPSMVIGNNDIFSSAEGFSTDRNFSNFYLAATKNFIHNNNRFSTTLGYAPGIFANKELSGIFGGISYAPAFLPQLKLMAEYDTKVINAGASVLLYNHLYIFGMAHELRRFAGGFTILIYLSK